MSPAGRPRALRRRLMIVKDRDRETEELVVRALGDDLVDDSQLRIVAQPSRQDLAQLLTILGLSRRKNLRTSERHRIGSFAVTCRIAASSPLKRTCSIVSDTCRNPAHPVVRLATHGAAYLY